MFNAGNNLNRPSTFQGVAEYATLMQAVETNDLDWMSNTCLPISVMCYLVLLTLPPTHLPTNPSTHPPTHPLTTNFLSLNITHFALFSMFFQVIRSCRFTRGSVLGVAWCPISSSSTTNTLVQESLVQCHTLTWPALTPSLPWQQSGHFHGN